MPIRWPRRLQGRETSPAHLLRSIFRRNKKISKPAEKEDLPASQEETDTKPVPHDDSSNVLVEEQTTAKQPEKPESLVETLFSGAPQFSIQVVNGGAVPSVSFPWDNSVGIREASDCRGLENATFSTCTLRRHLVMGPSIAKTAVEYDIGLVEVPNMLSSQGEEPGSVGFEYFLQDSVSDVLDISSEDLSINTAFDALENHQILSSSPERLGIRKFDIESIADRLVELTDIYRDFWSTGGKVHILKKQSPGELYTVLFGKILTPPKFNSSAADPTGLKVQIEALIRVLKLKELWYDFSSVEWRIRVGQILFAPPAKPQFSSEDDEPSEAEEIDDRDLLILQIILSCELLARLDSIAAVSAEEVSDDLRLSAEDIAEFRKMETKKTRWDLILARRFLRNIDVSSTSKEESPSLVPRLPQIAQRLFARSRPEKIPNDAQYRIIVLPRNLEQQLSGLFFFAKAIAWPDSRDFEEQLRSKLRAHDDALTLSSPPSIYSTPLSSPLSLRSTRSSYFDSSRPQVGRRVTPTQRSINLQPSTIPPDSSRSTPGSTSTEGSNKEPAQNALIGGWLTRTFMTGLILPGEAISHFLISALLENDATAIASLGDSANLYGGFSYKQCSWWSKNCVVGRVMAAVEGSKESMGWIFVPVEPRAGNGWFDIHSELVEPPDSPRIQAVEAVRTDGNIIGEQKTSDVKSSDLKFPEESKAAQLSTVTFEDLQFRVQNVNIEHTIASGLGATDPPVVPPHLAFLHFNIPGEGKSPSIERDIPLNYLVTYTSAFPCFPPVRGTLKISSTHDGESALRLDGHPLHISQAYRIVDAASLLSNPDVADEQISPSTKDTGKAKEGTVDGPSDGAGPATVASTRETIVIDARRDAASELLARAWCSWKGEHALLAQVGRTCLACAIREARALGIRIVIRIGLRAESAVGVEV